MAFKRHFARVGAAERCTESIFTDHQRQVCDYALVYAEKRSLFRYVFNDVEQCLTTALFTARADGGSESPPPLDFCKTRLWQVMDASIDLRDPNPN